MRPTRLMLIFVVLQFIALAPAIAQPGDDFQSGQSPRLRSPQSWELPKPPTEQQQTEARQTIEQLLAGHIDLDDPDVPALCRSLRDLARGTDDDPIARYVLLDLAFRCAVDSQHFELANQLIDDFAEFYNVDALAMRAKLLTGQVNTVAGDYAASHDALASVLDLLESALMADRFDLGVELVPSASTAAANSGDQDARERATRWSSLYERWSVEARLAQHAALRLAQQPDDSDARLALGRYLCFIKGDWSRGLPKFAHGSDEQLRRLAQRELATAPDDPARLDLPERWRQIAAAHDGLPRRRILLHADEIERRLLPAITGLTRLEHEQRLLSSPLLIFDAADPPDDAWLADNFHFRGGHGREGSGSWANISVENGTAVLLANRAGFIETLAQFPPPGVAHYEIEADLQSDLLPGTAIEFAGQRLFFRGEEGIVLENGWRPNVIYPIFDRSYHYLIDVTPTAIDFTVNGVHLGAMPTDGLTPARIVLRGWEGHLRCTRLAVWALPDDDLIAPLQAPEMASMPVDTGETADSQFASDLFALRHTQPLRAAPNVPARASSGEAIAAAHRVFALFPKPGMSRAQVLAVLGDPATISGYGIPADNTPDAPLIYRFDTGFGGAKYTIHFKDGCVTSVETQTLN